MEFDRLTRTGHTAGMHALSHGWHARSFTRLACTLFHTAGVHALIVSSTGAITVRE